MTEKPIHINLSRISNGNTDIVDIDFSGEEGANNLSKQLEEAIQNIGPKKEYTIDLSFTSLSPECAKVLAKHISSGKCRTVNLDVCNINNTFAITLAQAIESADCPPSSVDLCANNISDRGAEALLNAAKLKNCQISLSALNISPQFFYKNRDDLKYLNVTQEEIVESYKAENNALLQLFRIEVKDNDTIDKLPIIITLHSNFDGNVIINNDITVNEETFTTHIESTAKSGKYYLFLKEQLYLNEDTAKIIVKAFSSENFCGIHFASPISSITYVGLETITTAVENFVLSGKCPPNFDFTLVREENYNRYTYSLNYYSSSKEHNKQIPLLKKIGASLKNNVQNHENRRKAVFESFVLSFNSITVFVSQNFNNFPQELIRYICWNLLTCNICEPKISSAAALPITNIPRNAAPQPTKTDGVIPSSTSAKNFMNSVNKNYSIYSEKESKQLDKIKTIEKDATNIPNKPEDISRNKTHSSDSKSKVLRPQLIGTSSLSLFPSRDELQKKIAASRLDSRINQCAEQKCNAKFALACPVELDKDIMVMTFKENSVAEKFHETYFADIANSKLSDNKITLNDEKGIFKFITEKLEFAVKDTIQSIFTIFKPANLFSQPSDIPTSPLDIMINQYARRKCDGIEKALACPVELEKDIMVMTFKDAKTAGEFYEKCFGFTQKSNKRVLDHDKIILTGKDIISDFIVEKLNFKTVKPMLEKHYPNFEMPQPETINTNRGSQKI